MRPRRLALTLEHLGGRLLGRFHQARVLLEVGEAQERLAALALAQVFARPAQGDEDENIEPRTFTIARAWSLVRSGEIVDMKTVLGLAMLDGRVPLVRG